MNEDLQNEIEAINSIYGNGSLALTQDGSIYILRLPQRSTSLRIQFPSGYPLVPPAVLGCESSGENARKGEAAHIVDVFRDALGRLFQPGEVCMFDIIEEVNTTLEAPLDLEKTLDAKSDSAEDKAVAAGMNENENERHVATMEAAPWTLSDVAIEMKSVFVARCAPVSSPDQANQYLQQLLDSDKKVRSATHNITAWRIRGNNGVTYQDCDDDGETAAGSRVLHLMQLMDLWNVMVVVTRWYGGHQLGPKRFSIINTVARDAFVQGGFVTDESNTKKKVKR